MRWVCGGESAFSGNSIGGFGVKTNALIHPYNLKRLESWKAELNTALPNT
ncbi:MAG: hypothetical protein JETT_3095 [Candidatus Jettenia ecosi]|uniref:Uncharacterized protein n=1 Tax=Candidatus Jettenia ecosi TaxID=2494326 RepID=A0A533Q7M8_9BACT|nr:MAG: hypothetical protein JETT_3095 [Candidatus Jettenia ecosi]